MWLAGAGVKGGQFIGATDELGFEAVEERHHVSDLHATILHLMGLDHERLTYFYQGLEHRITGVRTVEEAQFVFVDTPGFQTKHNAALNRNLNRTVHGVLSDVDLVLFVVEAGRFGLDDAKVLAGVQRGVNVLQLNLEDGLNMFGDDAFDVVLHIDTLQHLRNAETMLRETARVGRVGIVAFPNFANWPNRLSILQGRMPVTKRLPYQWYDTPNIRVGTYKDFEVLAHKNRLRILDSFGLQDGREVRWLPNARAGTAVFLLENA